MIQLKPITYEEIEKHLIRIAFFGSISSGKTSIINAILSKFLGIKREVLITKHYENTNIFLEIVSSTENSEFKIVFKREN